MVRTTRRLNKNQNDNVYDNIIHWNMYEVKYKKTVT